MDNSYVIKKEQCPRCAKQGKDNSRDNLAVYSDGHKWCFSCKYAEMPSNIERWKKKQDDLCITYEDKEEIFLPSDCDMSYPQKALDWINKYELTKVDLMKHNVMWSDYKQRLIFPVYGDGRLIAWQGRDFSLDNMAIAKKPKWYGKGDLKNTFNILNGDNKNILVLTEDIVSAIKVNKAGFSSMPLYGSFIGKERFKRLYSLLGHEVEVLVWLDDDKASESLIEAKLGRVYGLHCRSIMVKGDPKDYSILQIKEIIE